MFRRLLTITLLLLLAATTAPAQQITLKIHHFLPPQAPVPKNFIAPWAAKVEKESGGKIKVEIYPAMQLGGKPPALFDQAKDGVVDIVWTLAGYTPGRFPKTEVFEMPFLPASGEATSQAAWDYYDKHLRDEFPGVQVIAVHTHGPGLLHVKGNGVHKLEDMKGLKLRGPTRMINRLLEELGSTPVGMPVPAVPEALSKGVIDGTVIPWEVTAPLKVSELVNTHTSFSGDRGFYTTFFLYVMNKTKYDSLPPDLKKVIDANSGRKTAQWVGRVMDEGDEPGMKIAERRKNTFIRLDARETQRWKDAAKPVVAEWMREMRAKGVDGEALYQEAQGLVAKYAK